MRSFSLMLVTLICMALTGGGSGWAQEGHGGMKMPSPEEMKAMMERYEKMMKPGEHHKLLEHFVGEWNVDIKMWMGGPQGPAVESKGTATIKSVLGGRFIQEELKAEMNMPDMTTGAMTKVPFEGIGLTGYDNYRNLYVASWADNINTHLLSMAGMAPPPGDRIVAYGEMDEPMMNVTGRMVKYVTRIVDKNKHVFEIIDLHAGENYKVLELTYTRK